jgi:hypothetical protein
MMVRITEVRHKGICPSFLRFMSIVWAKQCPPFLAAFDYPTQWDGT